MEENKNNEDITTKKRGGSLEEIKENENKNNSLKDNEEVKIENIKQSDKEKIEKKTKKDKKKIDKRIVIIILTIIICILVTTLLIIFKIEKLNEKYKYQEEDNNVFEVKNKKEDTDLEYVLKEGDRINYNDIIIEEHYYYNGNFYTEKPDDEMNDYSTYVQIKGLLNKDVENSINNRITEKTKEMADNFNICTAQVIGNISNILSIKFSSYQGVGNNYYKSMNIDLNTGNDIKFEDLFAKSTPIYYIVYEGFLHILPRYYNLSSLNYSSDEEYIAALEYALDMNNRDTSGYDDYLYKIIKEYNANKDNLVFTIDNSTICVYGFDENGTYNQDSKNNQPITIPVYNYKDYVTAYKKYINENLYENDVEIDGIRPMYKNLGYWANSYKENNIYYEKDNLLVDVTLNIDPSVASKVKEYLTSYIQPYVNMAEQDKDYFYVVQSYNMGLLIDEMGFIEENFIPYYFLNLSISVVKIPIEDTNKLEKVLAISSDIPVTEINAKSILNYKYEYDDEEIITIEENSEMLYLDLNGNYIGDNIGTVNDYTNNNQFEQS